MLVLKLVYSVIMMGSPSQNWGVTVIGSLYEKEKDSSAPNVSNVFFHRTLVCEECPNRSDQCCFLKDVVEEWFVLIFCGKQVLSAKF